MAENIVKVNIKLSGLGETFEHTINLDHTVDQIIDGLLEVRTELKKESVTLVRKGRILKPHQVLKDIKEGETFHLVNKSAESSQEASSEPTPEPQQEAPPQDPFAAMFGGGMPGMGGLGGMGGMPGMMPGMGGMPGMMPGMGGMPGGPGGLPGQMPMGLNPEMIANMLSNPMVQNMMNEFVADPNKMKNLFDNNPMLSQMAEGNEQLQDLINNPEGFKDAMNPEKMQEALNEMKNHFGGTAGEEQPVEGAPSGTMPGALPGMSLPGMPLPGADAGAAGSDPLANLQNMMGGFDPSELEKMMSGFNIQPSSEPPATSTTEPNTVDLKEKYKDQLKYMYDMGFADQDANIVFLQETNGDADQAIQKSLEKMGQS